MKTNKLLTIMSFRIIGLLAMLILLLNSCKKDGSLIEHENNSLASIEKKLNDAGFYTKKGFYKYKDGYIVEGDIFFTIDQINNLTSSNKVSLDPRNNRTLKMGGSFGKTGHYISTELLTTDFVNKRVITIYMANTIPTYYQDCLDSAINRYNAIDFGLTFQRITSGPGDIGIGMNSDPVYIGLSGFPEYGNPYPYIHLSDQFIYSGYNRPDGITLLMHEIGHAIGLRHTDFADTNYSCFGNGGVEAVNDGGANHIPGTPTGASPDSFMLACIDLTDRPFTSDDVTALMEMYRVQKPIYVKVVETVVDSSTSSSCCDMIHKDVNRVLYFYTNSALTIPYTTFNFKLNAKENNAGTITNITYNVPNGVTFFDMGVQLYKEEWQYGNLVYNYNSYHELLTGNHYYLR